MGRLPKPAKKKIFAITKCKTFNPLLPDAYGVVWTQHYTNINTVGGIKKRYIVDQEITREEALHLIKEHKMTIMLSNEDGTLWETTRTFRNECHKYKLKYLQDLRPW